METKTKFTIMIVHPETLQILSCFHEKGIPMVFDSEALAADHLKALNHPGYYKIDKYYIVTDNGNES
jgi:hypothetical protein